MSTDDSRYIVPIFATPFASVDTGAGQLNDRLARLCESQRHETESQSDRSRNPFYFRGPVNLLDAADGPAGELREVILGNALHLVQNVNSFTSSELGNLRIDARAWCSILQPNGHIPAQHFSGASWVAVYCVQSGEPDAGTGDGGILRIHETRLSSIYRDASTWSMRTPYRYGHYSWTPKPGWMAFFPAHIQHEVSVVRSSKPLILVFALIRVLDADTKDNRYG